MATPIPYVQHFRVMVNKYDVDQVVMTYDKDTECYVIRQCDDLGRLVNQRDEFKIKDYNDARMIVELLTDHLDSVGAYPYQCAIVQD